MAGIDPLMSTNKLKTTLLRTFRPGVKHLLFVRYDRRFDALMILFVPPETETIVHYVDEHVGLLYKPDDLEIVGMQVESFERAFLPNHDAVRRVWRLSDACDDLKDVGDLILAVERSSSQVAREVANATEDVLGKLGQDLTRAMQYAYA